MLLCHSDEVSAGETIAPDLVVSRVSLPSEIRPRTIRHSSSTDGTMRCAVLVALLAAPALASMGSCDECEACTEHCGRRCFRRAFNSCKYRKYAAKHAGTNLLDEIPRCCLNSTEELPDGAGRDRDCWTDPPAECRAKWKCVWRNVSAYWRCRRACDEEYTWTTAHMRDQCCYEMASRACGGEAHLDWEDGDEDVHNECYKLTMLHSGCPALDEVYDYDPQSQKAQVMENLAEVFSPEWKRDCEENSNYNNACWNYGGTLERARLTEALRNRHSNETRRMIELHGYWATHEFSGPGYAEAWAARYGQWDLLNDERYVRALGGDAFDANEWSDGMLDAFRAVLQYRHGPDYNRADIKRLAREATDEYMRIAMGIYLERNMNGLYDTLSGGEFAEAVREVLRARYPDVEIHGDDPGLHDLLGDPEFNAEVKKRIMPLMKRPDPRTTYR